MPGVTVPLSGVLCGLTADPYDFQPDDGGPRKQGVTRKLHLWDGAIPGGPVTIKLPNGQAGEMVYNQLSQAGAWSSVICRCEAAGRNLFALVEVVSIEANTGSRDAAA